MCGICGYSAKKEFTPQLKKYADQLVRSLLIETSTRGTDATGYVAHYRKDGRTVYMKKSMSAVRFLHKGYMDFKRTPDVLLCHARAQTTGSFLYAVNNHPFVGKKDSLVHNGVIPGWRRQEYDRYRERMRGECDSEILLRYYEENGIRGLPKTFGRMANYALGILRHKDGRLILLRDSSRPLVYADIPELGIYLFASTMQIIRRAIELTFRTHPNVTMHSLDDYKAYYIHKGRITSTKQLEEEPPSCSTSYSRKGKWGENDTECRYAKGINVATYTGGTLYKHTNAGNFRLEDGGLWELSSVKAPYESKTSIWRGEDETDIRRLHAASEAWEDLCARLLNENAPEREINGAWESYEKVVEQWSEAVEFYSKQLVSYPEEGTYSG